MKTSIESFRFKPNAPMPMLGVKVMHLSAHAIDVITVCTHHNHIITIFQVPRSLLQRPAKVGTALLQCTFLNHERKIVII